MNPDELEALMHELIGAIHQVVASGEELSDEFQGRLAQTLESMVNRIEELRAAQQQPTPGGPVQPAVDPEFQLLWMLSGQQEQAFISYLRTFPSAATRSLLNNPIELSQVLEQLNRLLPPGEQPVLDGIQHADLNSSNVWGVSYDPRSSKMKVRFQGGSVYEYDGVPGNIYRAFVKGNASAKTKGQNQYGQWWVGKNPSLGAALNQYIKASGFPYRKIQ
jgi:hypothetical protein